MLDSLVRTDQKQPRLLIEFPTSPNGVSLAYSPRDDTVMPLTVLTQLSLLSSLVYPHVFTSVID